MSDLAGKALIVDDDRLVCKIIAKILGQRGLETIIAENGSDANVAIIMESERLVLAVIDLVLPNGITGWDLIDHLHGNTATARIPIVVLTGAGISGDEAARLHEKTNAIVRKKDFNIERFDQVLDRLLGGR